ncbi:MAG TPA: IclR family transcriptional regulator [Candidatus Dormibacteraeota bacterium]|nr:IclR family transcriptional regulator [Candidatus Dormibacteraeota bacterium]
MTGDGSTATPGTLIGSVQRALRLLEAVSAHEEGRPAKALAREVGLALGTTYHLLRTLTFEGYLRRLPNGSYVLGEGVSHLRHLGTYQAALSRVRPVLAALRDQARAAAYLSLYEDGEIVLRDLADATYAPRLDLWVGFHDAGHATALGKAVLASLEPEQAREYLATHALADLTPRTITNQARLHEELERVRASGVAIDAEEYAIGGACVATPVRAPGVTGAVALSFRARRLPELDRMTPALRATARRIGRALALTI